MALTEIQQFFLYGGYVIGTLLLAAVISKRKTHRGYLLLCFLIILALAKQTATFILSQQHPNDSYLVYILIFLNLVTIPPIYFYVRFFVEPANGLLREFEKHITLFFFSSAIFVLAIFHVHSQSGIDYQLYIGRFGTLLVGITYYFLVIKTVRKFELSLKDQYSDISQIHLNWLRLLLAIYFVHIAVNTLDVITGPLVPIWKLSPAVAMFSIFALVYFSMKQSKVFEESKTIFAENKNNDVMAPEELEKYKEKLLVFLDEKKPFLNPHVTLKDLSTGIGLKPYKLSFLINYSFKTNFYNLMNSRRIEHAKHLLENPNNGANILEIAIESGFNSKSVFNDAFKKLSGVTPSQFRDSIRPSR